MESLSEITNNNSGGRQGGGSPGEQGAGEGGKRENEGQAAGSIWGNDLSGLHLEESMTVDE